MVIKDFYILGIQVKMLIYYHHNKLNKLETVVQFWNFLLLRVFEKTSYVFLVMVVCMV